MKLITTHILLLLFLLFSGCTEEKKRVVEIPKSEDEFNQLYNTASESIFPFLQIGNSAPVEMSNVELEKINHSIEQLKACVSYADSHWQARVLLGKAYQAMGEHRKSMDWILEAMIIAPDNHVIYKEASVQALYLRDKMKALYYSGEALKRKPNDPILLGNHALNMLITGDNNGAKNLIDKAIEIDSSDNTNQYIKTYINNVEDGLVERPTCATIMP